MQNGVGSAFDLYVEWARHPKHGGVELLTVPSDDAGHPLDLLVRPCAVESETPGAAEEFWCIGHHENRLHTDSESSDLSSTLLRHTHAKDCLRTLGGDRTPFVRAVQMRFRKGYVDAPSRLCGDLVGRILDEFEELAVAIPALGDPALSIRVLGYEPRVDGVSVENARGLLENGLDHWLIRR
ncbi:hypothetical protein JOC24_002328 [Streptomyces sp. HB132]|nr:hypothetical protein [Streptomyces sp. HB132]MBM7438920.1 hypothetical protein [Streptomyces sp. HB132]